MVSSPILALPTACSRFNVKRSTVALYTASQLCMAWVHACMHGASDALYDHLYCFIGLELACVPGLIKNGYTEHTLTVLGQTN